MTCSSSGILELVTSMLKAICHGVLFCALNFESFQWAVPFDHEIDGA